MNLLADMRLREKECLDENSLRADMIFEMISFAGGLVINISEYLLLVR